MNPIISTASVEFSRTIKHPLVIIISCFLFILITINGMGNAYLLPHFSDMMEKGSDPFLQVGISNLCYHTALLLSVLSFSIGILTIVEDRTKGSIRILLTKPLYRRELIAGKFVGLSSFITLLVIIVITLNASAIMIFYGSPASIGETILRLATYAVILSLFCIEMLGLAILIGVLFKNLYQVLIVSGTLLCFNWTFNIPVAMYNFMGDMIVVFPEYLFFKIIMDDNNLFDTSVKYIAWLGASILYIVFLISVILVIFLLTCYAFNQENS